MGNCRRCIHWEEFKTQILTNTDMNYYSGHGTTLQTGITCKNIPCYMGNSACRWFIVQKDKIFWSYVKRF